jgi:L-rhamnose-H+ transport protein
MFLASLPLGFAAILVAAVAGGVFGLQYRIMKKYTVENSSLLSLFFATIVVPTIAVMFIIPDWTSVIAEAGFKVNATAFIFGFGWGLGAITYAYGFNILGMALAAAMIKGLTIIIGMGWLLIENYAELQEKGAQDAILWTIVSLVALVIGTTLSGWAGIIREKEQRAEGPEGAATATTVLKPTGRIFWFGIFMCLVSGILSACPPIGYAAAERLELLAVEKAGGIDLTWKATLIRWMPMYWGGIAALVVFMGGAMIKNGTWKNYTAPGASRDFTVSSLMGCVHFLAQIPYGIGVYYLNIGRSVDLGGSLGWGLNIGMALVVATAVGLIQKEWKGASKKAVTVLLLGIVALLLAFAAVGYAGYVTPQTK